MKDQMVRFLDNNNRFYEFQSDFRRGQRLRKTFGMVLMLAYQLLMSYLIFNGRLKQSISIVYVGNCCLETASQNHLYVWWGFFLVDRTVILETLYHLPEQCLPGFRKYQCLGRYYFVSMSEICLMPYKRLTSPLCRRCTALSTMPVIRHRLFVSSCM